MEKLLACPHAQSFGKDAKARADHVSEKLKEIYPDSVCALEFGVGEKENAAFRLLVMARLSAQCTDKRVNEVCVELFEKYPAAYDMAYAPIEDIERIVRPCGVYRMKAANIKDASRIICEKYGGRVPETYDELVSLPGVGMKIANLLLGELFGDPRIVPDTHCMRLSYRFALTSSPSDPTKCERELSGLIEKREQSDFCHRLVMFGREYCRAQGARCGECPLAKSEEKA